MSFWTAVHGRLRVLVLAAVFCLFAAFGLMALEMQTNRATSARIVLQMVLAGAFGAGYAALMMARRLRYFPVLILTQVLNQLPLSKTRRPPGKPCGNGTRKSAGETRGWRHDRHCGGLTT
jgi:hypothetical protein